MVVARPGLDVSTLVSDALGEEMLNFGDDRFYYSKTWGPRRARKLTGPRRVTPSISRLTSSEMGIRAIELYGDEAAALHAIACLATEVLYEYVVEHELLGEEPRRSARRFLVVPGGVEQLPALLVLDPRRPDVSLTSAVPLESAVNPAALAGTLRRLAMAPPSSEEGRLLSSFTEAPSEDLLELFWISPPQLVLTSKPQMLSLCSPSPCVAIESGGRLSSAGVLCRDKAGTLGVTACFHGTGDVGTPVLVFGKQRRVTRASVVQDTAFIELGEDFVLPSMRGLGKVRSRRAPSEAEPVSFEGFGSRSRKSTSVVSHDAGLLRRRPSIQLKVQTPADTNFGDSGSALVDSEDQIVGFAFERSGIGEFPELTDWIWANNALAALGLVPV